MTSSLGQNVWNWILITSIKFDFFWIFIQSQILFDPIRLTDSVWKIRSSRLLHQFMHYISSEPVEAAFILSTRYNIIYYPYVWLINSTGKNKRVQKYYTNLRNFLSSWCIGIIKRGSNNGIQLKLCYRPYFFSTEIWREEPVSEAYAGDKGRHCNERTEKRRHYHNDCRREGWVEHQS